MEDPVIALVRFLVIKRLVGNSSMLMAVKEYLVDGVVEARINPSLMEYGVPVKELLVRKMRGVPTNPVWVPYVISDKGIAAVDPQKLAEVLQERLKEAEKLKKLLSGSED